LAAYIVKDISARIPCVLSSCRTIQAMQRVRFMTFLNF